jgi:hypothetical protein
MVTNYLLPEVTLMKIISQSKCYKISGNFIINEQEKDKFQPFRAFDFNQQIYLKPPDSFHNDIFINEADTD